jgi:uncharacterized protein (TIGR02145 family)
MKNSYLILILSICYLTSFSQQSDSFKDPRDGKTYKTVKIGIQWWFAENLAYKPVSGKYWAYDNDQSNISKYGYLYDWETAKTVCPDGWHLPSDSELTQLTDSVGGESTARTGESIASRKLKAKNDWKYDPYGSATNESGFNALPAGRWNGNDNYFYNLGAYAYFWSSSPDEGWSAWVRCLSYGPDRVDRKTGYRTAGFSIRCVKD